MTANRQKKKKHRGGCSTGPVLLLLFPLLLLLCLRENDGHIADQHTVTASLLVAPKLIGVGKFMALMGLE